MINMRLGVGSKLKKQINNNGMKEKMMLSRKKQNVKNYMKLKKHVIYKLSLIRD